jgi:tRNA A37 threonylcarbamoyladenosine dehydratase
MATPHSGSESAAWEDRFGGIQRLYGSSACHRLRQARILVVGLGGVGSWVAEALARTGIGHLTLVDTDEVCLTNTNRQLHALEGNYGQGKAAVMAQRLRLINPSANIEAIQSYVWAPALDALLRDGYDCVAEAIDTIRAKCQLLAYCAQHQVPVIGSGAAGGRRDPTQVRVGDIVEATEDGLLRAARKMLRRKHGFPRGGVPMGIPCVYSLEKALYPQEDGLVGHQHPDTELVRQKRWGTASFVTGTFGFTAAARIVDLVLKNSHGSEGDHP